MSEPQQAHSNAGPVSAPVPGSAIPQETLDWERFRKHHLEREGFEPNCRDIKVITLFHYFTFGAHEKYMGRLTVPNKQISETAITD